MSPRSSWMTGLHLAGEKRIGHPLLAKTRARAMAADEADVVAERQQFFLDRLDQRFMIYLDDQYLSLAVSATLMAAYKTCEANPLVGEKMLTA